VIDVISPCVTFNDHQGSTKSYGYMREHEAVLHELDFVPFFQEIDVDIPEGVVMDVEMHDGSHLRIRKLERTYDPTNRLAAGAILEEAEAKGEVLTGVLYVNPSKPTFIEGSLCEPFEAHFHRAVEHGGCAHRDPPRVQNQALPGDFGRDHGRVALARRERKYANSILRLHVFRLHCFCARQVLASYRSVILRDGLLETLCSTPSWRGAFFCLPVA